MNDQGPGPRVPVHHLAGKLQRGLELAGIEINPAQEDPILRIIRVPDPGLPGQFQGAGLVALRRGFLSGAEQRRGGAPEVMILTPGEGEDRPDEDKRQNPNQPAELVSFPGEQEGHPQKHQHQEQNQNKAG
jgi:hypothetical protein